MLLRHLAGLSSSSWLCFGDFNEILHPCQKIKGNVRDLSMISEFREALQDYNLVDAGYKGYLFTWANGRYGSQFIEEWLDWTSFCAMKSGVIDFMIVQPFIFQPGPQIIVRY